MSSHPGRRHHPVAQGVSAPACPGPSPGEESGRRQEQAAIERLRPEPAGIHWRCADDPAAPTDHRIEVKLVAVTPDDQFSVALNGQPVAPECIKRLHATNGRDARLHPEPLAPYPHYTITPDREHLQQGLNVLSVSLTSADPDLVGTIEIRELEVVVTFRGASTPPGPCSTASAE